MQKTIADYFKTQPVLKAWLIGSFARGDESPLSDAIDKLDPVLTILRCHSVTFPYKNACIYRFIFVP